MVDTSLPYPALITPGTVLQRDAQSLRNGAGAERRGTADLLHAWYQQLLNHTRVLHERGEPLSPPPWMGLLRRADGWEG